MQLLKSVSTASIAIIDKGAVTITDSMDILTDITGVVKVNSSNALKEATIEGTADLIRIYAEAHTTLDKCKTEHATAFDSDGNIKPLPVIQFPK